MVCLEITVKPLFFVFCLAPCLVAAQGAGVADPADPKAAVPAAQYRSVFADTPTGVEQEQADWKKANAEVGQFRRGHVDILKWEADQAAKRAKPPASSQAGSKP
jgi:hypothetical protein